MQIRQIRNATVLLTLGRQRLLVDPMCSEPGTLPGFRLRGGAKRRNPLVALPAGGTEVMESATGVLITHEHPDHLDLPAVDWIKERDLTVWASEVDAPNLAKKGLDARVFRNGDLGLAVEAIPAQHGRGVLAWLMGPVTGFYLAHPDEPSVYLTGDTVLTDPVRDAIGRLKPEVIVAPAGAANFGFGPDLIFTLEELVELARLAPGDVVFNHLEAIDHCPTTRAGLRERLDIAGVGGRVRIPADGEAVEVVRDPAAPARPQPGPGAGRRPGFQKWLTAKFAGT